MEPEDERRHFSSTAVKGEIHVAAADPGFPIGGADLVGGAPTPEVATF